MWLVQNEVCMSQMNKVYLIQQHIRFIHLKNIYVQRVNFLEFEWQEEVITERKMSIRIKISAKRPL